MFIRPVMSLGMPRFSAQSPGPDKSPLSSGPEQEPEMLTRMKRLNMVPPYGFDPNRHYVGSRFEETRKLDLAAIAKRVREDINAAQKEGILPKGKYSVRIERGGLGYQRLTIAIKALDNVPLYTLESLKSPVRQRIRIIETFGIGSMDNDGITEAGLNVLNRLQDITKQYNYDAGDSQYDYWATRFYDDVGFDGDLHRSEKAKALNGDTPVA